MIQYALKCPDGHQFDSWFQNAAAFDKLRQAGMVTCAVCGSGDIEKAIMAPRVRPARSAVPPGQETELVAAPKERPLSAPASAAEQALAEIKKHIEANSDYVGKNFAKEARAIHSGDAPERAIYGEANADEAKSLIEDGVPVAPLPFRPGRKSN